MSHHDPIAKLVGDLDPTHFGDPIAEIGMFANCRTAAEARDVLRRAVAAEVEEMLKRVADADAFDVVELMRMREFSPVPDPTLEWEGSALNVEIVAAMLLGRSSRKPDTHTPREETRPHEVIGELHDRAQRIGRLAIYRQQFEARISSDPLALLAAAYQGSVLYIRNLQYATIREEHESRLFDNAIVTPLMVEHLGYTYRDVLTVRDSMQKLGGDRMTKLRDETGNIVMAHPGTAPEDIPDDVMHTFMAAMIPFMFLPADRAAITPEDVAEDTGADLAAIRSVMESFSQKFDSSVPPARRVYDLLTSSNPFQTTPLISDGNGNYVETTNGVGLDSLRRIVEGALAGTKQFHRYDKAVRQVVSEGLALGSLEKVLRTAPRLAGFKYFAPADDESNSVLGGDCRNPKAVGKQVEGDGLFIVGDVAICLEVKGKSIASPARRGDVKRLWSDLKATIGDGCRQASRLESLIKTNAGLWLDDGTWLDLSEVRELRSVVALLDDVGPLGTSLGDLRGTGLLPDTQTSWVTSLHDLEAIAQVCDRPSEFLLYLRRRADSDVATFYKASDELDLFMLFMNAGLYIEPDPDEVRAQHPTRAPVTSRDRRRRARSAVPTIIGEQCRPLNAWMDRHNRDHFPIGAPPPEKPTYNALPRILQLIDTVDTSAAGMIRFGADLLALSSSAQGSIVNLIDKAVCLSQKDGRPHDGVLSFAGVWGHPSVFIGSRPRGVALEPVQQRIESYMRLKRHQLQSDRSYGLIFGVNGDLECAIYLNDPVGDDPELDALIEQVGLKPVVDNARPVPLYSRRPTRRLRGKKNKRR